MKRLKKRKERNLIFSAWHILVCEMPIDCLAYLNNENGSLKKGKPGALSSYYIYHMPASSIHAVYYIKLGRGG